MPRTSQPTAIESNALESRIRVVRGLSLLLDEDLAELYGVTTGALLQAVRRNPERFPADFMIRLSNQEVSALRSQFVISKMGRGRGGRRTATYGFTEQVVAMLSSVLRSAAAVQIEALDLRLDDDVLGHDLDATRARDAWRRRFGLRIHDEGKLDECGSLINGFSLWWPASLGTSA
jgi:hypothetical protein